MSGKWTIEQLEVAIDAGNWIGPELIVGDTLDASGSPGDAPILYFHLERPGHPADQNTYHFTFEESVSLTENFRRLEAGLKTIRGVAPLSEAMSLNV